MCYGGLPITPFLFRKPRKGELHFALAVPAGYSLKKQKRENKIFGV